MKDFKESTQYKAIQRIIEKPELYDDSVVEEAKENWGKAKDIEDPIFWEMAEIAQDHRNSLKRSKSLGEFINDYLRVKDASIPSLKGSEKQIAWANDIIKRAIIVASKEDVEVDEIQTRADSVEGMDAGDIIDFKSDFHIYFAHRLDQLVEEINNY